MLRVLAFGLVLANALFFAWTEGWFAPGWPSPRQAAHEPARLKAQVRPEVVTVVTKPAPAATSDRP